MRLLIVTAVWGKWHTDAFLNVCVPSMLTAGNMPALSALQEVTYRVLTTEPRSITSRLGDAVHRLQVQRIPRRHDLAHPIQAQTDIWREAIGEAIRAGVYVMLMPPDVCWSEGSLGHIGKLLTAGERAIVMPMMRLPSGPIRAGMSGSEQVARGLADYHPLMKAYEFGSPDFPRHREMVLWHLGDKGILVRVFARELLAFDPRYCRLNAIQLFEQLVRVHVIADSDNAFALSLAPPEKDASWYAGSGRLTPSLLARWMLDFESPVNDAIARTPVKWHVGPATDEYWQHAMNVSGDYVEKVLRDRDGLRKAQRLLALGVE